MKKMNKKGFTLIEMLAVIAIIAVLVAIVIPTVSSATEKAKEAADVANIRAKVAEVTTTALANGTDAANDLDASVTMTQETEGFVTEVTTIGGISNEAAEGATSDFDAIADATAGAVVAIGWDGDNDCVTIEVTPAAAE
jgi:prepilin-type N-terminal cleavage/methylation domain-containing protein